MSVKICTTCKVEKDAVLFNKSQTNRDRLSSSCKECTSIHNKQYSLLHKEEKREYNIQWEFKNKEKRKEQGKQRRFDKKEEIKEYNIQYGASHKEEKKEYDKQYCYEHREERNEYSKQYNSEHRKEINEYEKNKRETNPEYKLRKYTSRTIRKSLQLNGSSKRGKSTFKYLPYTPEELKQHIELLFEPWMTWENWTIYDPKTWDTNDHTTWTWNLDHIEPQTHLPYKSMEDENFKKCWALENLRPHDAKKNYEEGNRRTGEEIKEIKDNIKLKLENKITKNNI